jgi:hypothetical protein
MAQVAERQGGPSFFSARFELGESQSQPKARQLRSPGTQLAASKGGPYASYRS